jgi:hypothetical protein
MYIEQFSRIWKCHSDSVTFATAMLGTPVSRTGTSTTITDSSRQMVVSQNILPQCQSHIQRTQIVSFEVLQLPGVMLMQGWPGCCRGTLLRTSRITRVCGQENRNDWDKIGDDFVILVLVSTRVLGITCCCISFPISTTQQALHGPPYTDCERIAKV